MDFTSDNAWGISAPVMAALERANAGSAAAYGADEVTGELEARLKEVFETDLAVLPVVSGTAANALSIAAYTPAWGTVVCHEEAHILTSECGAIEFFTGGARLHPVRGEGGKIPLDGLTDALAGYARGRQHEMQAAMLSLTQATEMGTLYQPGEVKALCKAARAAGLKVHMDGARFANAVAALGCAPAEITWQAGVDVLAFGATKNGAMAAEAVILFDPAKAEELRYRRKRGGHLISKGRFVSAQLLAYVEGGHWLDLARQANQKARVLADGLKRAGIALACEPQANEVFPLLPAALDKTLRKAGANYHAWGGDGDTVTARLVTSFATPEQAIEKFISLLPAK